MDAKRALSLTEKRTVTVLRDEMEFFRPTDVLWVATPATEDITFSEDGRTVYLTKTLADGGKKHLRLSLLSEDGALRFETVPAEETLLASTVTK